MSSRGQVLHNIRAARAANKHVVLNPSPALPLPDVTYKDVDTLILNTTEANMLSAAHQQSEASVEKAAKHFLELGVRQAVIVTLGGDGVFFATTSRQGSLPASRVSVVDTTAAGDSFLGAYIAALAACGDEDFDVEEGLRFATAAAAIAVQRPGAMAAIPRRGEVVASFAE